MTNIRDRTKDFKDAVRAVALSLDYSESKLAAVLASFIMHKPPQRSPFTKAALKTLESINELEHFIAKHRKDYVDLHRTTEQERDNIEHEVSVFVKAFKDQIDILKNRIHEEEKDGNSTGWLSMRDISSRADVVAHEHGVAVEVTKNVVLGNKELVQAIKRNSSSRTFLLLFLFVLTFSILFLDWYS